MYKVTQFFLPLNKYHSRNLGSFVKGPTNENNVYIGIFSFTCQNLTYSIGIHVYNIVIFFVFSTCIKWNEALINKKKDTEKKFPLLFSFTTWYQSIRVVIQFISAFFISFANLRWFAQAIHFLLMAPLHQPSLVLLQLQLKGLFWTKLLGLACVYPLPNFKIRGCEFEYGYGSGDTTKSLIL